MRDLKQTTKKKKKKKSVKTVGAREERSKMARERENVWMKIISIDADYFQTISLSTHNLQLLLNEIKYQKKFEPRNKYHVQKLKK